MRALSLTYVCMYVRLLTSESMCTCYFFCPTGMCVWPPEDLFSGRKQASECATCTFTCLAKNNRSIHPWKEKEISYLTSCWFLLWNQILIYFFVSTRRYYKQNLITKIKNCIKLEKLTALHLANFEISENFEKSGCFCSCSVKSVNNNSILNFWDYTHIGF